MAEGNLLTEDDQWAKLKLVVDTEPPRLGLSAGRLLRLLRADSFDRG